LENKQFTKTPNLNVVIITREKIPLDFVNTLKKNKKFEFAQKYRKTIGLFI
jgi:hypothetical protein